MESLIQPVVIAPSGSDVANPHYSAELDALKQSDVITKSESVNTGDRGNVHYAKELERTPAGQLTGDRGNVHNARELEQTPAGQLTFIFTRRL